jgi:peptidoglycan hydrolase-like protein with peptidoglycan-binding domain
MNHAVQLQSLGFSWTNLVTKPLSEASELHPYFLLALDIIKKYVLISVTLIGIFGNVVSCCITTKKEYRHISTCLYMSVLAVVDTVCLLVYMGYYPFFFGLEMPYNTSLR